MQAGIRLGFIKNIYAKKQKEIQLMLGIDEYTTIYMVDSVDIIFYMVYKLCILCRMLNV